jgi:predicted phosphate transport protein (TIGR00153 family)
MRGTNPIAALFGRSPFGPIQEHMKVVRECADEIGPLFEALAGGDLAEAARRRDRIFELEHAADAIHEDIRGHLPRSLFLPVDRRDLIELLRAEDSIADSAQDVASLVVLRGRPTPDGMHDVVNALVDSTRAAVAAAAELIGELDELLATGFGGREADRVGEMISRVDELESISDDRGLEAVEQLFSIEETLTAVDAMVWYETLQKIGDMADYAEAVADRLRLLIAR